MQEQNAYGVLFISSKNNVSAINMLQQYHSWDYWCIYTVFQKTGPLEQVGITSSK